MACLYSCIFELEKENFIQLEEPTAPTLGILLNPEASSYTITRDTTFIYNLLLPSNQNIVVQWYLGDQLIGESTSRRGAFRLITATIPDGTYTLTLVAIANSGSGSIADQLGAELFLFSNTWQVTVLTQAARPVVITQLGPENGHLKVTWEKNTQANFERYIVRATYGDTVVINFGLDVLQISDPNQNFVIDSTYLGGKVAYQVDVVASGQLTPGTPRWAEFPEVTWEGKWVSGNQITFNWAKNAFFNNVKNYQVYRSFTPIFSSSTASSFIYTHAPFGTDTGIPFQFSLENKTGQPPVFLEAQNIQVGEKLPGISVLDGFQPFNGQKAIGFNVFTGGFLTNLNTRESTPLPGVSQIFAVSNQAGIMAHYNEGSDRIERLLTVRRLDQLGMQVNIGTDTLLLDPNFTFNLSKDGWGILWDIQIGYMVYDFVNQKRLALFNFSFPFINEITLSPDGQHMVVSADRFYLYRINYTTQNVTLLRESPAQEPIVFVPSRPDWVAVKNGSVYEIRDIAQYQVLRSFTNNATTITNFRPVFDPNNPHVMFQEVSDDPLIVIGKIYNYTNGQLIASIPLDTQQTLAFFLANGFIYSSFATRTNYVP
jgi:hypothetical protein